MNEKVIEVIKYFCLTFFSLELMYYIARSSLNIGLVLLISVAFTILYAVDKFKLLGRFLSPNQRTNTGNVKKDQTM